MNIAVLSDLHGNHIALEKCITEIEKRNIKKIIFLGDYIGELAYPQKTMKLLQKIMNNYECICLRGNKEDYWIDRKKSGHSGWKENDSTTGMLYYAYKNLTDDDLLFFEHLPYVQMIYFENMPVIAAYHGSHNQHGKKLRTNTDNSKQLFVDTDATVILCGHTHIRDEILDQKRILLNPGSVGMPLHSNGKSQFLILSEENHQWKQEFIDLEYDVESVIRELHEENLYEIAPYWTRITEHILRNGTVSHGTVFSRANQLCYEETGSWGWPNLPEKYWEQAVKELLNQF